MAQFSDLSQSGSMTGSELDKGVVRLEIQPSDGFSDGLKRPIIFMAIKPPKPPCGLRMCGDIVESNHCPKLMTWLLGIVA